MGNNFYMNSSEYSVYQEEQEVLLDDGVGLWVTQVSNEIDQETGKEMT